MSDGLVFDKASYSKGDTITVTVTDSTRRQPVPAVPAVSETVNVSGTTHEGGTVTGSFVVNTPAVPAIPGDAPGTVSDSDGRPYALVAGSDTGSVAKYTAIA